MDYDEEDNIILLKGQYKVNLKKVIGIGNYGIVYECEDISNPKSNKKLCAKLTEILQGSKLSREFEVLSTLKTVARGNLNIIQVIDVLLHNQKYILIQERCQCDLAKLIQQRRIDKKRITPEEALRIIKQLSDGYKVLLAHNIIHRDIKPQNILFLDGTYKIADFGFARIADRFGDHTKLGTLRYIAPEILWSQSYTCQADIFSLGVVFYQLIFDNFPFKLEGTTLGEIKNQLYQLKENPVKVSRDLPEFQADDSIPQLIERMLLFNQDERITWSQFFKHKLIIEHFENQPNNFVQRLPTPDTEIEQEQKQNIVQTPIFFWNQQQINTNILCQHYQIGVFFAYIEQEVYQYHNALYSYSIYQYIYLRNVLCNLAFIFLNSAKIGQLPIKDFQQEWNKFLTNQQNLKKEFQANSLYCPEERLELQNQNKLISEIKMFMKQPVMTYKSQNIYYFSYLKLLYALHQLAETNDNNLYYIVMYIQTKHNDQNFVITYLNQIYQ